MKEMIKKLFVKLHLIGPLLKLLLNLHNLCTTLITKLAIIENHGLHPKHRIIAYKEWFISHLNRDSVVLDIGSNAGDLARYIAPSVRNVIGIEIEKKLDRLAKLKPKDNIRFIHGDATQFDYSTVPNIDFVILSNVLEHIENRIKFLKSLHTIQRTDKRVTFLIRVPCIDRDWITIYKKEKNVYWKLDPTHFTEYTFNNFKLELKEAGLEIKSHEIRFGEIYSVCQLSEKL